ncbi:uncharacterized protein [Procambarus clarkii]|uniref:uncharacterized protein n=1 Tax=Procambarus clarkii TaxID=6728 RepID=UPI001E6700ED|nr:uncharacterized protein LOC123769830 [Procambarus clarkii]
MNVLNIFEIKREYIWLLLFFTALSGASVCQVNETSVWESEGGGGVSMIQGEVFRTCPGPHDPANHTACCYTDDTPTCCLPVTPPEGIFLIDDQIAMIIALSVTTVCVILTIVIIICCFWSHCPLFSVCRIRYHQDDIIAYANKDEETAGLNDMPPEITKGVSIYSPNTMKVTLKNDI